MFETMLFNQATTMNQIRFYQLRMMECPIGSDEREVYKQAIRALQDEMQKTLFQV